VQDRYSTEPSKLRALGTNRHGMMTALWRCKLELRGCIYIGWRLRPLQKTRKQRTGNGAQGEHALAQQLEADVGKPTDQSSRRPGLAPRGGSGRAIWEGEGEGESRRRSDWCLRQKSVRRGAGMDGHWKRWLGARLQDSHMGMGSGLALSIASSVTGRESALVGSPTSVSASCRHRRLSRIVVETAAPILRRRRIFLALVLVLRHRVCPERTRPHAPAWPCYNHPLQHGSPSKHRGTACTLVAGGALVEKRGQRAQTACRSCMWKLPLLLPACSSQARDRPACLGRSLSVTTPSCPVLRPLFWCSDDSLS